MSSFFEASRQFESGKPRPKQETNVALLRLPSSSPALIHSSNGFKHFASKERRAIERENTTHTYSATSASVSKAEAASGSLLPSIGVIPCDRSVIPDEVAATHEAHRQKLEENRRSLLLLEERDANDVARRAKAKRLEEERSRRIRRIAAGLQGMGTIDFDPEEGAPSQKLRTVLGSAYHPQAPDGYLTATPHTTREGQTATIADYFGAKPPTMVYATDGIYGTHLHSTVAEASAVRALEASSPSGRGRGGGGRGRKDGRDQELATSRLGVSNENSLYDVASGDRAGLRVGLIEGSTSTGANSHQLKTLLLQQQIQMGGLQGLALTVGEEAAANVKNYLKSKYGPSMLWPASGTEAEEAHLKQKKDAEGLALLAGTVGGPMSVGATPTTTVLTAHGPAIQHGVPRRLLGQSASQLAEALITKKLREQEIEEEERKEKAETRKRKALREAMNAGAEMHDYELDE